MYVYNVYITLALPVEMNLFSVSSTTRFIEGMLRSCMFTHTHTHISICSAAVCLHTHTHTLAYAPQL